MRRGCGGRVFKLALLLGLLLMLLVISTHRGQVALKSGGLLIETFPNAPLYPLRLMTDPPTRTEVGYPGPEGTVAADLYRPAGEGPFGALVLYIGIGPETRNPNVVRLAEGLARTGVAVLVPTSPELSRFRLVPEEKEWVIAAFEYLSSRPYVEADRVGIMGVSAGGSLVAVAAQDPRIRDEVCLLELFGSYYSAASLLEALTVRSVEVDGERQEWQPDDVPLEVFRDMILPTLPPSDRAALAPLFDGEQPRPPPDLSTEGAKVAAMLLNRDPDRVPELLAALPPETRALLAGISPKTGIEDLQTELFLLHDRDDSIIPFTESRAFATGAVNASEVHLTELRLFRHVEPQAGGDPARLVQEAVKLYLHVYEVLLRLA